MVDRLLSLFRIRWDGPLTAPRSLAQLEADALAPFLDQHRADVAALAAATLTPWDLVDPATSAPSWHDLWPEPWGTDLRFGQFEATLTDDGVSLALLDPDDDGHGPRAIP